MEVKNTIFALGALSSKLVRGSTAKLVVIGQGNELKTRIDELGLISQCGVVFYDAHYLNC